jgi:excisionase family DNA binding protein
MHWQRCKAQFGNRRGGAVRRSDYMGSSKGRKRRDPKASKKEVPNVKLDAQSETNTLDGDMTKSGGDEAWPPEGYVTTIQAAIRLGSSSVNKVYALVKAGELRAYKVPGRKVRLFKVTDLDAYMRPRPVVPRVIDVKKAS